MSSSESEENYANDLSSDNSDQTPASPDQVRQTIIQRTNRKNDKPEIVNPFSQKVMILKPTDQAESQEHSTNLNSESEEGEQSIKFRAIMWNYT